MKRWWAVAALLCLSVPVMAQRVTKFEQITVAAAAIGITNTTIAGMAGCSIRLETAEIRFRYDGTDPTAAVGTLLEIGDVLTFANINDARFVRFIRTGGTSGVIDVSCWPQQQQ